MRITSAGTGPAAVPARAVPHTSGGKAMKRLRGCGRLWLTFVVIVCGTAPAAGQVPAAPPKGTEPAYVRWLEERSMLHQAALQARRVSGTPAGWRHPYAAPQPEAAVRRAWVWLLAYDG